MLHRIQWAGDLGGGGRGEREREGGRRREGDDGIHSTQPEVVQRQSQLSLSLPLTSAGSDSHNSIKPCRSGHTVSQLRHQPRAIDSGLGRGGREGEGEGECVCVWGGACRPTH